MSDSSAPLSGYRIVGFTHIGAGPYALSLLGDMGADVINIESLAGDNLRARDGAFEEMSGYFLGVNRNKRAVSLDLRDEGGREAAISILRTADAVVENFRPGSLERLGFGYEDVKALQPNIVYFSVKPWGSKGPMRNKAGMDLLAQGRGGMMSLNGMPGQPPCRIPPPVSDFVAAYLTCYGVTLALLARERFGVGQYGETSLLAGQVATMANFITYFWQTGKPDAPVGSANPQLVPYQPFQASDRYFIVAAITDAMFRSLCDAIGWPNLATDPSFATNADRVRNREQLTDLLSAVFRSRTADEWEDILEAAGVPVGVIQRLEDLYEDEQIIANGYIRDDDHPVAGPIKVPGFPIVLEATPGEFRKHAPRRGEHTVEVLAEAGVPESSIRSLLERGAAYSCTAPQVAAGDVER